jgi:hypothetical protein
LANTIDDEVATGARASLIGGAAVRLVGRRSEARHVGRGPVGKSGSSPNRSRPECLAAKGGDRRRDVPSKYVMREQVLPWCAPSKLQGQAI